MAGKRKTAKESIGAPAPYEPKPTMYLEGKHARAMKAKPVGSAVRMVVHGRVVSQSVDSGEGGKRHSARIEVSRVRPFKGAAPPFGTKGK